MLSIKTLSFEVKTRGNTELVDITDKVEEQIRKSNIREGNALVFIGGSTAGITTIEYEPGLISDYPHFFEKLVPSNVKYKHDETWHDGNGHSHIRAALQGASFTVPFVDKDMLLGTWQQIILIEFDIRPRNRKVIIQITGQETELRKNLAVQFYFRNVYIIIKNKKDSNQNFKCGSEVKIKYTR